MNDDSSAVSELTSALRGLKGEISSLSIQMSAFGVHMDYFKPALDKLTGNLDTIVTRVTRAEDRLDSMDRQIVDIVKDSESAGMTRRWIIGVVVTIGLAITGLATTILPHLAWR